MERKGKERKMKRRIGGEGKERKGKGKEERKGKG
jgi:hypothetical protein